MCRALLLSWLLSLNVHDAAASASCPCSGDNTGLDKDTYGDNYGTSCKSWDDGITDNSNREHCGTYEDDKDGLFCCRAWCYVDAANCEGASMFPSFVQAGSSQTLFFSYDTCDGEANAETGYTEETCPFEGPRDFQPDVKIRAKVRDFTRSHAHFGCNAGCGWPKDQAGGPSGHTVGMLKAELVDGKPVLVEKYSGSEEFNQWYSESTCSEAVWLVFRYDLEKKLHRYDSTNYLPLGKGTDGEEEAGGLFTTEIRVFFRYNGGEVFQFRGDDDVWVFINNKLAIDIGGCHGPVEGEVNLDSASENLGLEVGKNYELILFQAERCYGGSNFKAEMTLRQDQGVCPNQCFVADEQGHCDVELGTCVCYDGWSGADCGIKANPESVTAAGDCTSFGSVSKTNPSANTTDLAIFAATPSILAFLLVFQC